jgi:hypothetical protein
VDLAVGVGEVDLVDRAGAAAEEAERRGRGQVAVAEDRRLGAVVEELQFGDHAEAAAPLARPGRIGHVLVAPQQVGIDELEHLRVLRRDRAAGADQADVVEAVGPFGPTAAALAGV